MVISISIAIIIILTVLSAGILGIFFRAYPGWRSTIEGILIKIGGLMFGPIIGLFIGAITDLLTVILTAGMFHYGYFIAALAYGFFAGLIRTVINISKNKTWNCLVIVSVLCLLACSWITYFLTITATDGEFHIEFLGVSKNLPLYFLLIFLWSICSGVIVLMYIIFLCNNTKKIRLAILNNNLKNKYLLTQKHYTNLFKKKNNLDKVNFKFMSFKKKSFKFIDYYDKRINELAAKVKPDNQTFSFFFIPVLALTIFGEGITSITIMPVFDSQLSGNVPIDDWIGIRMIIFPVIIVVNSFIITPIFSITNKMVSFNYADNLIVKSKI